MPDLLSDLHANIFTITFNRLEKHNAFDDKFLKILQDLLDQGINKSAVRVILLKANGNCFSAGADLNWMQRMVNFSAAENFADALVLAKVINTIYNSPKPTIAMVQGPTFGGGVGLVAACDIAIASTMASFCLTEVTLGLIPAVISPYVVKAIGERAAKWLFISAANIDAQQAKNLCLVHYCLSPEKLWDFTYNYAKNIATLPQQAVKDCKTLVDNVVGRAINQELVETTAAEIARKRISLEGQQGLQYFLEQKKLK